MNPSLRNLFIKKLTRDRVGLVERLGSRFVDGRHQITGRGLLDHVTRSGDAVQFALLDFVMQPTRLLIDIDQAVVFARKYDRRHRKLVIGL